MALVFSGIRDAISRFLKGGAAYERAVEVFVRDLQRELIRSDVNIRLVGELSDRIRRRALEEKPPPGLSRYDWFVKIVYEELVSLLGGDREPDVMPYRKPYTIMLVGLQGSGKTTSAAKLAWYYKNRKLRVGLLQTDTYRPAAYEQLKQLADTVGVVFYGEPDGRNPVDIALRGLDAILKGRVDVVIIDTAGRHGFGQEERLLEEMRALAEAIRPDEVMFVLDASVGQKAGEIAERFHKATPIGSIMLTKLDGTAKGGGALAAVAVTGARIKFVGTGEKVEDIEVFKPRKFVARILGLGDLEGLLERVSMYQSLEEQKRIAEDLLEGRLSLRTVYHQLRQLRRLGPLSKVLGMLPGFPLHQLGGEQAKVLEEKMDRWMAIIQSMTYEELDKPELVERDKSRQRRVAMGSGTGVEDVRELIQHYKDLKKMVTQLKRRKDVIRRLMESLGAQAGGP